MATKMKYRGTEHVHEPGKSSDVFDGLNYQNLCREHVKVNGRIFAHKYFDDEHDIALGLSTDGLPLIIFNYNLPPKIQFHIDNILSLGVIPGPKKPVDMHSYGH
jgi:hypothetical protein